MSIVRTSPVSGGRALIEVGYGCNEHCTFCHTLDVRHVDGEAKEVHAKIERAEALGHEPCGPASRSTFHGIAWQVIE